VAFTPYTNETSLPNLDQKRSIRVTVNFEISLRAPLSININAALLDQSARFRHRRRKL
jgi:hypothetical protein